MKRHLNEDMCLSSLTFLLTANETVFSWTRIGLGPPKLPVGFEDRMNLSTTNLME